ncbi:unnamed protein product [Adineta ricciae]|uniref:Apple domain-containing protein n=1 Tax=Adineta ricciae TaxID=249248 RepID=A0A815N341_ADIRI|nr:unnamed protein product [Adineta ricciae]CAF1429427.1 unnamed protein product [Adineta ricciae]
MIILSIIDNTQYRCVDPQCSPITVTSTSTMQACQSACLINKDCRTATFDQSNHQCDLFIDIVRQYGQMITNENVVTMTAIDNRQLSAISERNWIMNGDAETGPCASDSSVVSPTDWNHNGTVTQAYYNNTYSTHRSTEPGPSDRGSCHFYGQASPTTAMWQKQNFTSYFCSLIDAQTVRFNFSAWIGGAGNQDDVVEASLRFFNQSNQMVGNTTTIGPVRAADRGNVTSLLFRQANGLVPSGTRSFEVFVKFTRSGGTYDNGAIDNIVLIMNE